MPAELLLIPLGLILWGAFAQLLSDRLYTYLIVDTHYLDLRFLGFISTRLIDIRKITNIELSGPDVGFTLHRHGSKLWARWVYIDIGGNGFPVTLCPKDPEALVSELVRRNPDIRVLRPY